MGDVLDPEEKATSDYAVVKDQGPTLSFNVYNKVIHPLAEAWLGNPDGIQGDYEFSILRATTDSIVLRGRKWKNEMVLTRLPKDTRQRHLGARHHRPNHAPTHRYLGANQMGHALLHQCYGHRASPTYHHRR